ncbi:hypothetical protein L1887_14783 [Cichorium endivia]|nr:hypothetical protein L1887_14783 [Cichorium endivia]
MGRVDQTPVPQSSDQTASQLPPPPQGYPNHHDNPLSSPKPPQDAYLGNNNQHMNQPQSTRSYVPQSPENLPPPESYPPQKQAPYLTQQQTRETYPPQQPQAAYPPQPGPAAFPPQQQPPKYPPQPPPVDNAAYYNPQSYNHTSYNAQPQVNYGGTPNGVPIGIPYHAPTQGWTTGILDCFDDPENADSNTTSYLKPRGF